MEQLALLCISRLPWKGSIRSPQHRRASSVNNSRRDMRAETCGRDWMGVSPAGAADLIRSVGSVPLVRPRHLLRPHVHSDVARISTVSQSITPESTTACRHWSSTVKLKSSGCQHGAHSLFVGRLKRSAGPTELADQTLGSTSLTLFGPESRYHRTNRDLKAMMRHWAGQALWGKPRLFNFVSNQVHDASIPALRPGSFA